MALADYISGNKGKDKILNVQKDIRECGERAPEAKGEESYKNGKRKLKGTLEEVKM